LTISEYLTDPSGINRPMSIIRPLQRLRHGPVLIALSAGLLAAALAPAAAAAPQTHHLEFHLSGPSPQDIVGTAEIKVRARCPTEACTVTASATSEHPALHTGNARVSVPAGGAATLKLPLAPRQRGKLKAALAAGHSPTFTVNATARDHTGTKVPLTIQVRPQKH
jgi:hypothetical protein